jgi:hypothetical protein
MENLLCSSKNQGQSSVGSADKADCGGFGMDVERLVGDRDDDGGGGVERVTVGDRDDDDGGDGSIEHATLDAGGSSGVECATVGNNIGDNGSDGDVC